MRFRGGEFSTGTKGNFQSELTVLANREDPTTECCAYRTSSSGERTLQILAEEPLV